MAEAVLDRAAVLIAFEQIGGMQACRDVTRLREKPLRVLAPDRLVQAIKHKLADMYVGIGGALERLIMAPGRFRLKRPSFRSAAASRATAVTPITSAPRNIQTHGGMGFTWEVDCHLFFRRAKLLAVQAGSPAAWKEKLVKRRTAERRVMAQ